MWACHTVSQSSNKVEHSTMSTDAGLVHVVSLYLPESRENSTRMEKKRGGKKRHIGTMVSLLKKKKKTGLWLTSGGVWSVDALNLSLFN